MVADPTICGHCRAKLDENGICPRCEYYAQKDREHLAANADKPLIWRVQVKKQRKGLKVFQVRLVQGSYTHEEFDAHFTWSSKPSDNPVDREYYGHKWECTCGKPNCHHISVAQAWQKQEKKAKAEAIRCERIRNAWHPMTDEEVAAINATHANKTKKIMVRGGEMLTIPRYNVKDGQILCLDTGKPARDGDVIEHDEFGGTETRFWYLSPADDLPGKDFKKSPKGAKK